MLPVILSTFASDTLADTLITTAFINESVWQSICGLSELSAFSKLQQDILDGAKHWEEWSRLEAPEQTKPPGDYGNMSAFQICCILRAIRPDRLTAALRTQIQTLFGKMFIDEEGFNIFSIYRETAPQTAAFFYLFAGRGKRGKRDREGEREERGREGERS